MRAVDTAFLDPKNKRVRVEFAQRKIKVYDGSDPKCLHKIVTGHGTCVYYFESKRKAENKAWVEIGTHAPQIVHKNRSPKKVLYTLFSNRIGIIFQKPHEKGPSITGLY